MGRKIISLILAVVMLIAMAAPVFSAGSDPEVSTQYDNKGNNGGSNNGGTNNGGSNNGNNNGNNNNGGVNNGGTNNGNGVSGNNNGGTNNGGTNNGGVNNGNNGNANNANGNSGNNGNNGNNNVNNNGNNSSNNANNSNNNNANSSGNNANNSGNGSNTSNAIDASGDAGAGNGGAISAAAALLASGDNIIYLKGSGNGKDDFRSWNNVFYLGGATIDSAEFQDWHLVIGGKKDLSDSVRSVQLTFDTPAGIVVWTWIPAMGYSFNGGGNNPGWIVVAPLDWILISGKNQNDSFMTIAGANPQFNISGYGRFENPYVTIAKTWTDGNPDSLIAIFDIYAYDADSADHRGDLVCGGLPAGVKVKLAAGVYVIAEQVKPGYAVQPDQIVTLKSNDNKTFAFVNEPVRSGPKGAIELDKYIDGVKIVDFDYEGDGDIYDLIIGFNLYKVSGAGAGIEGLTPIGNALLDSSGQILFSGLADGWYAVEEILSGQGELYFEPAALKYIEIKNEKQISGAYVDFAYDAFYTIVNGYGSGYTLGYPGLNNNGDIFYIGVTNTDTGVEYPSYCANAGSQYFAGAVGQGCSGYYKGEAIDKFGNNLDLDKFLAAFNWIEDNVGNLNANRGITQTVIWALLGAIDVDSHAFAAIDARVDQSAVKAALAATGMGGGKIADLVFMVCDKHDAGHNYDLCQPQLVPIYSGGDKFDNETITVADPKTTVGFGKSVYTKGDEEPGVGFIFKLFKWVEDDGDYTEYIDAYTSDALGQIITGELTAGKYVFFEADADGYILDNYKDGLFFEITVEGIGKNAKAVVAWTYEDGQTEGDPAVLNIELGVIETGAEITLYEEWIKQTHKLKTWSPNGGNSLTSSKDNPADGLSEFYNTGDNEVFFKVDIAALKDAGDAGLKVWIAARDGHNVNASLGYYYIIKIDALGRPIVTLADENIISWTSLNVNAFHWNGRPVFSNNGSRPSLTQINARSIYALDGWISNRNAKIFAIDAADESAGYFWFHFHMNGMVANKLDVDGKVICEVDQSPSDSGKRLYGVTGYTIEFSIDGGATMNSAGVFDNLTPGVYTVEIYYNGIKCGEKELEVFAGETTSYTFDVDYTVNEGDPVKIVDCDYCDEWL